MNNAPQAGQDVDKLWDGYVNSYTGNIQGASTSLVAASTTHYMQLKLDQGYTDIEVRNEHAHGGWPPLLCTRACVRGVHVSMRVASMEHALLVGRACWACLLPKHTC